MAPLDWRARARRPAAVSRELQAEKRIEHCSEHAWGKKKKKHQAGEKIKTAASLPPTRTRLVR